MNNDLAWQKVLDSTTLEKDQRLSRSILWRLQTAFYQQSGIAAWNRGFVPHYITNNPYIAGAFARVVLGFLRDHPPLDPSRPVYILELGAGSGRFAFHFLQRLLPALADSSLSGVRFTYLLTDLAESNVQFWRTHPRLQPFLQSGQLDLACFDPLHDEAIHLAYSGANLTAADFTNPPVVLANYFFDSLPNDLFSIHNGLLCEELITLAAANAGIAPDDPAIVPSLETSFHPRLASPRYYHDPDYNRLLQAYLSSLDESYLLFPLGALDALRALTDLSNGRMLFLTADKGFHQLEDLRAVAAPEISLHGNGISMMVNFHALQWWIEQQGGQALHAKHRTDGLVISALMVGEPSNGSRRTRRAFREAVEQNSPDDFFMLKKALEPHYADATLEQLLAFLRFSGNDPQIIANMTPVLVERAAAARPFEQERLYDAACCAWDMAYPIGEPLDLSLSLAKLFIALSRYNEALECLRESQQFNGPSAESGAMIALCRRYVLEE